jgi:hypothetical protein
VGHHRDETDPATRTIETLATEDNSPTGSKWPSRRRALLLLVVRVILYAYDVIHAILIFHCSFFSLQALRNKNHWMEVLGWRNVGKSNKKKPRRSASIWSNYNGNRKKKNAFDAKANLMHSRYVY